MLSGRHFPNCHLLVKRRGSVMKLLFGVLLVSLMVEASTAADTTMTPTESVTGEQSSQETDARRAVRNEYFWGGRALKALRRILEYTHEKANQFNLDGMVGPRMAQGQLRVLLRRAGPDSLPTEVQDEIYDLTVLITKVIDRTVPFIARSTPDYYNQMGIVISEGFFEHDYDMRKTNDSLVYPDVNIKERFTEVLSDHCLSELQGTGDFEGRACSISDNCWDLMTAPHYRDYPLTHQVLYLVVAETMQCGNEIITVNEKFCRLYGRCHTAVDLQEILCANVVKGMKRLEARDFPGNTQDLFMEQAALCGILGFSDVCSVHWLKLFLSWQQPSGCYIRTDMDLYRRNRQKRYDVLIDDDCSAHKTSVAAGAFGVCIRFHVEDPVSMGTDA